MTNLDDTGLQGLHTPAPIAAGQPAEGWRTHALATVTILGGLLLIYWRTGSYGYVNMDDVDYAWLTMPVVNGLTLDGVQWAFTSFRLSNWHPLTWLSYMLDYELFGVSTGAQHLVNVALHGATSLVLYAFARRLLDHAIAAFVVAFTFMAHPLHVESVAWIAERKDVLCGLFYLLALLGHERFVRKPSRTGYVLVLSAGALALLSKPMAVTLPVALLLLDLFVFDRLFLLGSARQQGLLHSVRGIIGQRAVLEKIPLFAMALATGTLTVLAQEDAIGSVSPGTRCMNAVVAYATYVRQLLLPVGLAPHYPFDSVDAMRYFLPSLAVLAAISWLAWKTRARQPFYALGWSWMLLTLLPVIGLLQVGTQAHADRYMYIPSVGPLLALGAFLAQRSHAWLRQWRAVILLVLLFLSGMAWLQTGYWANQYMFYSRMLDANPRSPVAHVGLSSYFLNAGDLKMAAHHAALAIELDPSGRYGHYAFLNLGNLHLENGEFALAEQAYRLTLVRRPEDARAMNSLGIALERQGRAAEARTYYERAQEIDPGARFLRPRPAPPAG